MESHSNPHHAPSSSDSADSSGGQLSTSEKIGYGLGDTASNLYWKLFENFQLYFYTEVFGLAAGSAATMFFVTKIWDAINDPLMGVIADRTRTSWGRFRPYLIWMALPFAITGILTFHTPELSDRGKLIYAYVTYTLVFTAYTAINIPYGALMGVISASSLERTSVSTYRFVLAFLGGLIVQLLTLPLVRFFGGTREAVVDGVARQVVDDPQTGFFWTVVVYAAIAVILFVITFASTRERVVPEQNTNASLWQDALDLFRNRPWMVLLFVGLFQILAGWTRGSATGYYFDYYVDIGETGSWFDVGSFGNFFAVGTVFSILGMLTTTPLVKRFGKRRLMIMMMLGNAVCMGGFRLLDSNDWQIMYALHALGALISGPMPILLWAMYADVADYSEWVNHRRATGLVFAAATLSQQLGSALGAAVPGWALSYSNFVNRVDNLPQPQSDQTISGIVNMMSIMPAIFLLCGGIAMLLYNIDGALQDRIEFELRQRKNQIRT